MTKKQQGITLGVQLKEVSALERVEENDKKIARTNSRCLT